MADVIPTKPHARSAGDVAAALECDPGQGLATGEAERRRRVFGANRLRVYQRRSWLSVLAHQFASLLVWLLAAAALLSFLMRDVPEALAIIAVLVINAGTGFATELRAVRSMESLRRIARVRALVRRDGRVVSVAASDLVPGDVVVLGAGDIVAADLRLVKLSNLESNESILTGESVPVAKRVDAVPDDAVLGDRTNMVFKGTGITKGSGEGIVTATGMATELGRISDLTESAGDTASPLEQRLDRLAQRLVVLTLGLAAMMVLVGTARGHALSAMVETGIALAVAAVPEGLPVVATLCLARGMWRMAARNAVITRLSSVETLGATTLIMTDKTGTLTENQMAVVRYLVADGDVTVTAGLPADPARVELAVRLGAACATRAPDDDLSDMIRTDPMDLAMLEVADRLGLERVALEEACPKVAEHAFDPAQKMMATVRRVEKGFLLAVKGAPEAVIAASGAEWDGARSRPLDAARRAEWTRRLSEAAAGGLRLIALATKTAASPDADPFGGLTLVALVGLRDPLRADIPEAIRASRAAGVRVVMLTGDHADTAVAIATDAGIGDSELKAAEGTSLCALEAGTADDDLCNRIRDTDVFARVAPETKLALVRCFQDAGHVVAMTGDGVNDAPALRKADIGIAMGRRGTEVAREAADMVLKDDSFATIIAAMHQGRVIYDNIRRFVVYLMSCNVSEVLVVGIAVGAGLPAPLMPLQILFLNLVTDVFPAFALGFGHGDPNVMRRPPRDPREPIAGRPEWALIALLGSIVTAATLVAFWLALTRLELPNGKAVSVAFLTLALAQLWNVFNVRADGARFWHNDVTRNPYVWAALVLCAGLLFMAFRSPGLSGLLDLPNPGPEGLWLAVGLSLVPLIAGQLLLLVRVNGRLRSLAILKEPASAPTTPSSKTG